MTETDQIPMFKLAVDTRLLYQYLRDMDVGSIANYSELDDVIGRDVRNAGYSNLASARRRCLNHDGIVFGTVKSVGLKRLNDQEIVATADGEFDAIRRKARHAARKVACSDYSKLETQFQGKHNAALSLFGAVANVTKTAKVKLFEDHVSSLHAELSLTKTLEFFSG